METGRTAQVLQRIEKPAADLKRDCSTQMRVKPSECALDEVALVPGIREHVAFVFVDDEFRLHAQRFQRVPKLVGLRSGTFAVAVADENKRGCLGFFDE